MVTELNTSNFDEFIKSSDIPVVVDFWAEWCGPCRALAPVVEQMSKTLEGKVRFAKVDIDANSEFATPFDIKTIPALIAFSNGEKLGRIMFTGLGFTESTMTKVISDFLQTKGITITETK